MGKPTERSRVYFLGAGASADAGVPLTNALLPQIHKKLQNGTKHRWLFRFIEQLGFLRERRPNRPAIVDAISLLDSCLRDNRPLDRLLNTERLREIRNQLTIEVAEVVGKRRKKGISVRMPQEARDQPGTRGLRIANYFKQLALSLRTRNRSGGGRLGAGDTVITTNYDTNIDVALYELVYWEETTGDADYSHIWDIYLGSDFRDPYTDEHAMLDTSSVVDLFKLHGSLNWLYCPRCHRIFIAAFGFSVRLLGHKKKQRHELTCWCEYFPLEPVLVAPSAYQEVGNPHLQAIWMNAYHALETADTWIFAGYSLPPEDLAVRSLLYRALTARRDMRVLRPRIRVVCPTNDVARLRSQYEGLLGKPIEFSAMTFSAYVKATMLRVDLR